jgi:hypothetical protein
MTGIPWNAAASALEMTASTAISLGNRAATSLPVVKNGDKPDGLPASDILQYARTDGTADKKKRHGVLIPRLVRCTRKNARRHECSRSSCLMMMRWPG